MADIHVFYTFIDLLMKGKKANLGFKKLERKNLTARMIQIILLSFLDVYMILFILYLKKNGNDLNLRPLCILE